MAEIKTYAEQCPEGGAIIHMGATSMDVLDNVDALRLRTGLNLLIDKLAALLAALAARVVGEAERPPSPSPTSSPPNPRPSATGWPNAQDLLMDLEELHRVLTVLDKRSQGAVGTSASYTQCWMRPAGLRATWRRVMASLGLEAFEAATQTLSAQTGLAGAEQAGGLCGYINLRSTCASSKARPSVSGANRLGPSRWVPAPCPSSATPSSPRTSTA
ncbi:MAG: hypothetical protein R2854_12050 [Caldilineaceae bacterium]